MRSANSMGGGIADADPPNIELAKGKFDQYNEFLDFEIFCDSFLLLQKIINMFKKYVKHYCVE